MWWAAEEGDCQELELQAGQRGGWNELEDRRGWELGGLGVGAWKLAAMPRSAGPGRAWQGEVVKPAARMGLSKMAEKLENCS